MPKYILLECGIPAIVEELPEIAPSRLGVIGKFWEDEHAFSATDEYAYTVENPPAFNSLQIVLAYLIYNPPESVDGRWVRVGPCRLEALIQQVERGLDTDDDIIQQWFSAVDVIRLLKSATTFDEMLVAVDAVCGGHEHRDESLELVERVLGDQWRSDA